MEASYGEDIPQGNLDKKGFEATVWGAYAGGNSSSRAGVPFFEGDEDDNEWFELEHFIPTGESSDGEQILPLPRYLARSLTQPTTFITIGPSQVGKSTFLSKVLAREDIGVGEGQTSHTFEPSKHAAISLADNFPTSYFIDTVGILDSRGEEQDVKNKEILMNFLEKEVDKELPVVVLLFFRKLDSWTGAAIKTVELGAEIARKYNSDILVVYTYANSTEFPSHWHEKTLQFIDCDDWEEAEENAYLAKKWKEEKDVLVHEALIGLPHTIVETDFGLAALKRGKGRKYQLYDGTDCMKAVANAIAQVSKSALFLMNRSRDQLAKDAAKKRIEAWLKDTLSHSAKATAAYAVVQGGLTGIIVGGSLAAEGASLGTSIAAAAAMTAVGTVGGAAIAFVPVLIVTGVGVALHLYLTDGGKGGRT